LLAAACCLLLVQTSRRRQKGEPKIASKNHVKSYNILHKKHASMPPVAGICATQKDKLPPAKQEK